MALEKIGPPGSEVSNAKECRDLKKCMNSSLLLNTGNMEDRGAVTHAIHAKLDATRICAISALRFAE